jgi:hypothetical protein
MLRGPSRKEITRMSSMTLQVQLSFIEDRDRTRVEASMDLGGEGFTGVGQARRAPDDPSVPIVGEELAVARALSDLSHKLIEAATERIEQFGR